MDYHWYFGDISTGFSMDFNWYFIELYIEFQLEFQWISIGISLKFHIAFCLFVSGPATDDKHCFDCLLVVSTIDLLGPGRTDPRLIVFF